MDTPEPSYLQKASDLGLLVIPGNLAERINDLGRRIRNGDDVEPAEATNLVAQLEEWDT